ncbi:Transcription elongation factor SPT5 [Leucoagaricus sp. SymC.cos]|nr:Transcription elongation factor SPT5 [Leucoagaricus sp. SymC.cos]
MISFRWTCLLGFIFSIYAPFAAANDFAGANSYFLWALSASDRAQVLDAMKAADMKRWFSLPERNENITHKGLVLRIFIARIAAGAKGSSAVGVPDLESVVVGQYDDTILNKIDQLAVEAHARDIKLVIAMHDRYALGCWDTDAYVAKYNLPVTNCNGVPDSSTFYTNSNAIADYDNRLRHILNFQSPNFGVPWKQLSDAIFAFEIENEGMGHMNQVAPNWWCDRANTIRSVLGNSGTQISTGGGTDLPTSLQSQFWSCANLQIIALHDYNLDTNYVASHVDAAKPLAINSGKRMLYEEFGALGGSKQSQIQSITNWLMATGVPWMYWEIMKPGQGSNDYEHRHRRSAASRFLDIEAEVSDDDEEEDEEDDMGADPFIEQSDDMDEDMTRRHHASLDARRQLDEEEQSPEEIAKNLSRRYAHRAAVRYTGDMNEIPQRLLMPSVQDASLWQVRVKPGRERDIVFSLMRKALDVEFTAKPLNILSAFQRDSLPGMIYVEARSSKQVSEACAGLVGVYPSRGIHLVPIEEMASLLQIKKQEQTVTPGSWVRIRRGKYAGDLAQVMDITDTGEDAGLKFIPRIDLNPRDDVAMDGKKRKKIMTANSTMRPPQRLFNYEEVAKVYGRKSVTRRNDVYVFQNDTYRDGFIEKDFKISALILEDVNPTLDEITQFTRRQDGEGENPVDLSIIAEASRKAAVSVLQPGDHVEVFEGEQAGVHGVVEEINQDVVTISAVGPDIEGQKIELPARSVRKRFKPGDHVKVMTGQNVDETGLVVSVTDNIVTFLSDMSMQEVSVFSKDLREAAEVGSGTNVVGNYELHDLVQLDAQTVGVIFKTERDSFRVLDQNGQVRLVQPHQISMRRDSNRAVATDRDGHEIRINDNMKESEGEGRKGRVLHIYQSFYAFLHNRDITENGGVFVTRTRSLVSVAPKGSLIKPGADLSKMNPALVQPTGGMVGSGNMGRGPKDRHIGVTVMVVKGPHKGYAGTIKDTNGNIARVELRTGNKLIMIDKEKLYRRLPDGKLEPLDKPGGGRGGYGPGAGRTANPYANAGGFGANAGGRTPFANTGRTPNPYASNEGRTPAWNTTGRTPNPYADGGKTPAWNASSRTPNPYAADGGKTPAWNASSRTPNPYASGGGASSSWGGATPGRNVAPTGGPSASAWGGATPGRTNTGWGTNDGWASPRNTGWNAESTPWSAPTPSMAPTPATAATPAFISGPTPAPMHTPGPSARTPASWGGGQSAPTPFTSGFSYSASLSPTGYVLDEDWMFESIVSIYLSRIRVMIHGTRLDNYREGQLEGKQGCVRSAHKTQGGYEQEVVVVFDDGSPEETLPAKYVRPIEALRTGEEALAMDGPNEVKGRAVLLRANADSPMVEVSPKGDSSVYEVSKTALLSLKE